MWSSISSPPGDLYDSVADEILKWAESRRRSLAQTGKQTIPKALTMLGYATLAKLHFSWNSSVDAGGAKLSSGPLRRRLQQLRRRAMALAASYRNRYSVFLFSLERMESVR
jgi:hypothetical protein